MTIKGKSGAILADYIIGKSVKGRPGFYYIRRPQDNSVYVAKLNIDLSTKFADWIETNLLQLGSGQLKQVIVNKYSISDQGQISGREVTELSRDKAGDPWKLKGLDEAKEELNTPDVDGMVRTLEDLRIVGVRPKPAGLSQDLKQSKSIKIDTTTMLDLQSRGFFFTRDGDLVSQEGELLASTNDGVNYVLRFGEVFTSSEDQTETGIGAGPETDADKKKDDKAKTAPEKKDDKAADKKDDAAAKKDGEKKDGDPKEAEKKGANVSENRYVFINVTFDPKKLGPKPVKPEPPAEEKKPDDKKTDDKKPDDNKPEEKKPEEKKPEEKKPEEAKKDEAKPDPKAEELKKKYEEDLKKYETDIADYDKRMKEGKEKVAELNRRFADWYYVISADSFNKIRLSRKALVKEKAAPGSTPPAGIPGAKGLPGLNLPAPGDTPGQG
ncbi:MAG: DUF4340 domain-containing protein [Planctomycetales bacterium]